MRVFGIDPGYLQSAFIVLNEAGLPVTHGIVPNDTLLNDLRHPNTVPHGVPYDVLVIEKVEGFGMAVGKEVFETVYWSGRFHEAAHARGVPVHRVPRKDVKIHLCGSLKAKDPNIRQALVDLYGGSAAKGTKRLPGPLFGISKDVWSALAVARTFQDGQRA